MREVAGAGRMQRDLTLGTHDAQTLTLVFSFLYH